MYQLKKIIQFILIEMLYKKYVIEVNCEVEIVQDVTLNNSNLYNNNQIQIGLVPIKVFVNVIKYVANNGYIGDFPVVYETYEEAYSVLSSYYYTISSSKNFQSVNINTIYNDMTPPVEVLRSMKLKKLLK